MLVRISNCIDARSFDVEDRFTKEQVYEALQKANTIMLYDYDFEAYNEDNPDLRLDDNDIEKITDFMRNNDKIYVLIDIVNYLFDIYFYSINSPDIDFEMEV